MNRVQTAEGATQALASVFDFDTGRILPSAYSDQSLYELELERVFARSWLFICHEDHIPKPGDFFATYMAEDPVISVRQKDGSIKVLLNMCRHRGMRICRTDQGNARAFTCSYHGWAYDIAGNLVNVPNQEMSCGPAFDRADWPARAAPRVESYKGMVFASWDADIAPLTDYLGGLIPYLDAVLDRRPGRNRVIGGVLKWVIPCNWKFAAEQFASDMTHGTVSHASAMMGAADPNAPPPPGPPVTAFRSAQYASRATGHGSGIIFYPPGMPAFNNHSGVTVPGADIDAVRERRREHSPLAADIMVQHLNVFPTFSVVTGTDSFRVWHPRGPGEIEVWAFSITDADATDNEREHQRLTTLRTFSPAGTFEQDDGENWVEIQRGLRGLEARRTPLSMQQGLGMSIGGEPALPGTVANCFVEDAARGFYGRWLDLLSTEPPASGAAADASMRAEPIDGE